MADGIFQSAVGSLFGIAGNLLKKKVKAPEFIPVDVQKEQAKAISGNQANLPAAQDLASNVNQFNQAQLLDALKKAIPNLEQINTQAGQNISDQLAGRLPADVVGMIQRSTAAQNQAAGVSGSGFGRNLTSRDLGLNSLQLMQQGFQNANAWLSNVRANQVAPQFDVSSMFVTPAQQIQVTAANNEGQMKSQFLKSQLDAAQSPRSIFGSGIAQFGGSLGALGAAGGVPSASSPSVSAGVNFGPSGFQNFGINYNG